MNNKIKILSICCGATHGLVITNNKQCYSFGENRYGQCGTGTKSWEHYITEPHLINLVNNYVVQMSCGFDHSVLLTNDNRVYSFGDNNQNQCSSVCKDNTILLPYYLDKQKEFKISSKSYVDRILASTEQTIIIINPYK